VETVRFYRSPENLWNRVVSTHRQRICGNKSFLQITRESVETKGSPRNTITAIARDGHPVQRERQWSGKQKRRFPQIPRESVETNPFYRSPENLWKQALSTNEQTICGNESFLQITRESVETGPFYRSQDNLWKRIASTDYLLLWILNGFWVVDTPCLRSVAETHLPTITNETAVPRARPASRPRPRGPLPKAAFPTRPRNQASNSI
jgi:hypothetical protein